MGIDGKDKQDIFDEYFDSKNAVIIDGVNVAECACGMNLPKVAENYVYCEMANFNDNYSRNCAKNPNCYFKQLQHLKAENEELKAELELNTVNAVIIDMAERLHKYKQALERNKRNGDIRL